MLTHSRWLSVTASWRGSGDGWKMSSRPSSKSARISARPSSPRNVRPTERPALRAEQRVAHPRRAARSLPSGRAAAQPNARPRARSRNANASPESGLRVRRLRLHRRFPLSHVRITSSSIPVTINGWRPSSSGPASPARLERSSPTATSSGRSARLRW